MIAHSTGDRQWRVPRRVPIGHPGLSLRRSRRGQKGQEGQKQGRNDFPKVPCLPKLDRVSPSFEQGAKGRKGRFSKTFPPTKAADSPKLTQSHSNRASRRTLPRLETRPRSSSGPDRRGQIRVRLVGDGPLLVQGAQPLLAEAEQVPEHLTGVLPKER